MRRSIVSVMFWDGLRATLRLPMAYEMLERIDARCSDVGVLPEIELTVELRMRRSAGAPVGLEIMQQRIFAPLVQIGMTRQIQSTVQQGMRA
jgi:hypothetical protein